MYVKLVKVTTIHQTKPRASLIKSKGFHFSDKFSIDEANALNIWFPWHQPRENGSEEERPKDW